MTIASHAMQDANRVLSLMDTIQARINDAQQVLRQTGASVLDEPFLRLERALSDVKGEAFRVVGAYLDAEDGKAA